MPDQVFLGLTRGQNFGPPKVRPAKYPAISEMITTSTTQEIQTSPASSRRIQTENPATRIHPAKGVKRRFSRDTWLEDTTAAARRIGTTMMNGTTLAMVTAAAPRRLTRMAAVCSAPNMRAASHIMMPQSPITVISKITPPIQISAAPTRAIAIPDKTRGARSDHLAASLMQSAPRSGVHARHNFAEGPETRRG